MVRRNVVFMCTRREKLLSDNIDLTVAPKMLPQILFAIGDENPTYSSYNSTTKRLLTTGT